MTFSMAQGRSARLTFTLAAVLVAAACGPRMRRIRCRPSRRDQQADCQRHQPHRDGDARVAALEALAPQERRQQDREDRAGEERMGEVALHGRDAVDDAERDRCARRVAGVARGQNATAAR